MKLRLIVSSIGTLLAALLVWAPTDSGEVGAQGMVPNAPVFEVDPFWPKPLPNNWLLGSTIGVSVDSDDHVWIVHRGNLAPNEIPAALDPPFAEACCHPAPPILEFDQEGNLVQHWGGPGEGYDWPESNHGIWVDPMDNVWIGGNGADDSHALKFSHSGEFLLQIGEDGYAEPDSNSRTRYQKVAKVTFDAEANEGVPGRRLRQPARGGGRRHDRRAEALLGRLRQHAERRRAAALRRGERAGARCGQQRQVRRPAVPEPGALRRPRPATAWSTHATGRATACRCSPRRASSSRRST